MTDRGRNVHVGQGQTGEPRQHLRLTLPACGLPVRLARQVTREVLDAWQLSHVEETAVLLVSELVTNAVRHARCADEITLELQVVQARLRIEAYRRRPGTVVPRTTGEFDRSGFEFALVDSLADTWGVRETVTGKTAWAELDVSGKPGPQAR